MATWSEQNKIRKQVRASQAISQRHYRLMQATTQRPLAILDEEAARCFMGHGMRLWIDDSKEDYRLIEGYPDRSPSPRDDIEITKGLASLLKQRETKVFAIAGTATLYCCIM